MDWIALLLALAIPIAIAYSMIRSMRAKRGRETIAANPIRDISCPNCGYDLRATPHRCPECGTDVYNRRGYLQFLAHDWPADAIDVRIPGAHEEPVVLLSTLDGWEASMLAEQLGARGVFCRLSRSELKPMRSQPMFTRVMVYSGDLEIAREFLRRAKGFPAESTDESRPEAAM